MEKTSKSGYEIRLEILRMAMDIESTRWSWENDAAKDAAARVGQAAKVPKDNRVEAAMKTAEVLYKFVENKK